MDQTIETHWNQRDKAEKVEILNKFFKFLFYVENRGNWESFHEALREILIKDLSVKTFFQLPGFMKRYMEVVFEKHQEKFADNFFMLEYYLKL